MPFYSASRKKKADSLISQFEDSAHADFKLTKRGVEINGVNAVFNGLEISYHNVVEAIANQDTVPGDNVGGSLFIRLRQPVTIDERPSNVVNLTFDDESISDALAFVERVKQFGAVTAVTEGRDAAFRGAFFIPR